MASESRSGFAVLVVLSFVSGDDCYRLLLFSNFVNYKGLMRAGNDQPQFCRLVLARETILIPDKNRSAEWWLTDTFLQGCFTFSDP